MKNTKKSKKTEKKINDKLTLSFQVLNNQKEILCDLCQILHRYNLLIEYVECHIHKNWINFH